MVLLFLMIDQWFPALQPDSSIYGVLIICGSFLSSARFDWPLFYLVFFFFYLQFISELVLLISFCALSLTGTDNRIKE